MKINKQCMEKILQHLVKLICITEFENLRDLKKLVDLSTSVSAQLLAICENDVLEDANEEIKE